MPDLSTCNSPTCAVTVEGSLAACPKCGGPMRAVTESRARGWILVFCGLVLILMMGVITLNVAPMMLRPGEDLGGSSWEGTAEQGRMALALFGVIILFGFASLANGLYQIRTGEQHRIFMIATLALAALLVLTVFGLVQTFSESG